jgi:hypothetical protein
MTAEGIAPAAGLDVWKTRNTATSADLRSAAFSGDLFAVVGDHGTILTSSTGEVWLPRDSMVTNSLRRIAFGKGRFVAVGDNATIVTSTNGIDWHDRTPAIDAHLYGVVSGDSAFFVVGVTKSGQAAVVLRSTNGLDWTEVDTGITTQLQAITYGGGTFVAVAFYFGDMFFSSDGITWTVTSGCHNTLLGVTYARNKFVAVGYDSYTPGFPILTSFDGKTWQEAAARDATLYDVAFGGGFFVSVGGTLQDLDWFNLVVSSRDSFNWETRPPRAPGQLFGVAYGLGTFVVVGENGLVMQSGDVTVPRVTIAAQPDTNGLPIAIYGEPAQAYHLQATADLTTPEWVDIASISNASPATTYIDHDSINHPHRFYRLISP